MYQILKNNWRYVYICEDEPKENPFGSGIFIPLENSIDYAYIWDNENKIIICFCGTKNDEAWLNDFTIHDFYEDFPSVHAGFYKGWMEFEKPIFDYLKNNVNPELTIEYKGFSRGSALCTLGAYFTKKKLKRKTENYNFASPRVGLYSFVLAYSDMLIPTIRVVNGWDMICEMPTTSMGFYHIGTERIWLEQPVYHKYFYKIRDHKPNSYNKAIINL